MNPLSESKVGNTYALKPEIKFIENINLLTKSPVDPLFYSNTITAFTQVFSYA